ncbi:hypothetical protein WN944_029389 [Citrus x changshan-huyou]|uniref:Uncharacterized protein n=1 Tax=Citrus x changshan-huyou TaxID=2935761 RepID=A0AAP0LL45_9ROSI
MGHFAIDCYNHMNHAYLSRIPPQRLSALISTSTSFGSPNWLTDTGVNAHITPDNGNLVHPRDYNGQDTIAGVDLATKKTFSTDRAVMVFIPFLVKFFSLVIYLLMLVFAVMLEFSIHDLDVLCP